jgi:hypothetical protein
MEFFKAFEAFQQPHINDEFWNWFGNSKVVDSNGQPLVVYHGTSDDFKSFDRSTIGANYRESEGAGFFFTQKLRSAQNYALLHTARKNNTHIHASDLHKGYTIEVFLKIEKPLIRKVNSDYVAPADYFDINRNNLIYHGVIEDGCDGIIIEGTYKDNLYIVLNPNQIKSIKNKGSWDINSFNIYN